MSQYSLFSLHYPLAHLQSQRFRLTSGIVALFLAVTLALTATPAQAGLVALYDVDVLVTDESSEVRQQAFIEGMNEIFVRIAGDSMVVDKLASPEANHYVKKYSYVPVDQPVTNAKGEVLSRRLKIQYNGSLMEKYLRDNGFSVWGEHRSDVVVWVVVRDGKNEYILKDADKSLIKSVTSAALTRRGIPEVWPLYDKGDKQKISIADLRGGFEDPVVEASKRYSHGPILTASLSWNGKQWQSSWSLLMVTGNHHWRLADESYNRLINKAVDQAADAMGIVFAIRGATDNPANSTIQLDVQAVNSIEKYRQVENYLTNLSAVSLSKALKVDGQSVTFEILLRSNEEEFLNIIKNDGLLAKTQVMRLEPKSAPVPMQIEEKAAQPDTQDTALQSVARLPVDQPAPAQVRVHYYRLIH